MRKVMLLLMLLCIGFYASAQTATTGVVSSGEDGSPLIGVSVIVKGTAVGTVSDIDGNFSITLPSGRSVLVFEYIGYKTKEVSITGSNSKDLKVVMETDSKMLSEVVAIGYGTTKRSDLTGAVSSIGVDQIKKAMSTSLEQAMQGRIAGVQVTQNTGAPGGGISVAIRGTSSLNGNEPLYVIDGVAISGKPSDDNAGSVLSTINPSDIVSIEVLKDASATAIYGSRAANGVVMITTKTGESGKPKLSYDGYFGLQQLPKQLDVMKLRDYAQYYNDRATIQGWGLKDEFRDPSLLSNGTDWQSELFRTAPMHNHTVSISGGSGGVRYMISGGYLDQQGIGKGSDFRRFTMRNNMDMEVAKWLTVGINASIANTERTTTLDDNNVIGMILNQRVDVPAKNPDGTFGQILTDQFNTYNPNPLAEAEMKENYDTSTPITYNFYANIKPLAGLTLRLEYGGNMKYTNYYKFTPNYTFGNQAWQSNVDKGSGKNSDYAFKTILTYERKLAEKHNLSLMATHEANHSSWESLSATRSNYISNSVHSLHVGDSNSMTNDDSMDSWAMESWLGRVNYNFDDRYLLTATIRSDGVSTFGPDNRWGTFPSAALAWRIKNESFLKDVEAINNLKLRLGWGIVGNQAGGSYAYGERMSTTAGYWGTGYFLNNYGNPKLQWERTTSANIGLDLTAFNNKVELIVDAYNKNTDNLLMQATLPSYVIYMETWFGTQAPWVNTGAMNNKGMEFTVNTVNIDHKDFQWKTNVTFSFNRNELTKMYTDGDKLFGTIDGNVYTLSQIGQPVGQLFGYKVIGMFTKESDFYQKDASGQIILNEDGSKKEVARPGLNGVPYDIAPDQIWVGDYIFQDVNGDGVIDEKDRTVLGNTNPKFVYGMNNTITWKDFELNFFFSGVYGNKLYNMLAQNHSGTDGYAGKLKSVAGFARVQLIDPAGGNVISNVEVTNAATATASRVYAVAGNKNDNERMSSRFVEDGSYLKMKNVGLTYSVPKVWLQRNLPVDFLQVYASVQNLFTLTKYTGYDPEVGSYNVLLNGVDNSRYPSQRTYTFGLRFNF